MCRSWCWLVLLPLACSADDSPAEAESSTSSSSAATTNPAGSSEASTSGFVSGSTAADETAAPSVPCSDSPDALADCVEQDAYVDILEFVAQTRSPAEPHWQVVQDYLAAELDALGFDVELHTYETGVNVIGRLPGTVGMSDVILSAHYDSVFDCAGADDNASGVAGVLESARVLAMGQYENDLVIAFWDQEEVGLLGSRAYVDDAIAAGHDIVANYNYEMIGYTDDTPGAQSIPTGFDLVFPEGYAQVENNEFRGDFIILAADDLISAGAEALVAQAQRFDLPIVHLELGPKLKNSPLLSDLRRSDHAPFWEQDIPAMMITDTSEFRYPNYHCDPAPDTVDLLDHAFATKVTAATVGAAAQTLVMVEPD